MLYTPKLRFNLVSISHLVKEDWGYVTITDKLCVIQDRISGMPMEWVRRRMGYTFIGDCLLRLHSMRV